MFAQPPPILRLAGEIDESNYPDLTGVLAVTAARGDGRLELDLADVTYCDLAGLRAILSLADAPGVRQVRLRHLPEPLSGVLRILGWDTRPGLCLDGPG